jgi:dynein heavy chain
LYFVIADLAGIDPMYQNSLAYVKSLFNKAIAQSPQADDIEGRLEILIDRITRMIYTNVSRGLFEKDKIIYSFLITTGILRQAKKVDEAVWSILLRGPTVFTANEQAAKLDSPDLLTVPAIPWETLVSAELRSQGQFEGLTQHVVDNWAQWKAWSLTEMPYEVPCPGEYANTLSAFDKLILMKGFRNELVQQSIAEFIIRDMGKFYVESPSTAMSVIYPQLSVSTPLIFVLTQGADPTSILLNFAAEQGFAEKMHPISLGQGQGPKAEQLIRTSMKEGEWVMLQNCHLARSWMPALEKIVLNFAEAIDEIHPDFRLFLTSMPAPYFPVSVLQNSVKLTVEPPRGMKANLKRSYTSIHQSTLDKFNAAGEGKPQTWRKLLFSLAFFHAALQERRKFGPLGWNIRYEFNDSDLETTFTMLELFLESQDEVPWDALMFVTGHINYGGRVTDDNDRVCLLTTLGKYCCVDALKDGYKFSGSGLYFAPADGNIDTYRDYIETLPLNDSPEIYGLHGNANINYQNQESLRVIETILSIQPRLAQAAGGMTPDEIVLEKGKELLEQLPQLLDQRTGAKHLFVFNAQGLIPSLSTVLVQELTKFNRLLKKMKQSLVDMELAIKGFIVMSEELDSMYLRLQNNQVPLNWAKVGYPSLKPLSSWYKDFLVRVAFFETWLTEGNPASYWLPGMFFPQGFMTGVLQTHARQYRIAIDKLAYSFEFLEAEGAEDVDEAPEDGVYVHGLFMDGARWDREAANIADQVATVMFDTMPVIHFKPQEDFKPEPEDYLCPLYKTSLRAGVLSTTGLSTNFVLHVASPSKEPPAHWVQRAAAMLCMLND